jgi:hypothetical protein
MATCRSSLENTRKINSKPILNKTSPRAHTKSELDVLGVPRKLVKYVVHSSKRKIDLFIYLFIFHTNCPNCNQLVFGINVCPSHPRLKLFLEAFSFKAQ